MTVLPTVLVVIATAAVVAALLLLPFRWFYLPMCLKVFQQVPWLKSKLREPLADREDCEFSTADGVVLRGSYLATTAAERSGVVLFCHELSGDRWGAIPYTELLRSSGFDIFTFDFRNHGLSDSTPDYEPIPWSTTYELADVEAALTYLSNRSDADPRGAGLLGVSRGGTTALCAAGRNPRVRAVATDGAFPTLGMLVYLIRRYMSIYTRMVKVYSRIPDGYLRFLLWWTTKTYERQSHCEYLPVERLCRRIQQPVLLIHGEEDTYIPLSVVQTLQRDLPRATQLWTVPGAKHNNSIAQAPEEYQRRLVDFFRAHLTVRVPVPAPVAHSVT